MTQETRETLTAMLQQREEDARFWLRGVREEMAFRNATHAAVRARKLGTAAREALALRDVLTPRTCADCAEIAEAVSYYTGEDVDVLVDRYRSETAQSRQAHEGEAS